MIRPKSESFFILEVLLMVSGLSILAKEAGDDYGRADKIYANLQG
jgi:hypothetical protein